MRTRFLLLLIGALLLTGCETPAKRLGPPPPPLLGTRPPEALPAPPQQPLPDLAQPKPLPPAARDTSLVGRTIVVDAGHGGKDPGALGVGPLNEKTITLQLARRLTALLEARGARVVMTRSGDTFIELEGRAATAERYRADFFVSVHADSARRAAASGASVYIARGAAGDSYRVAQEIEAAFRRAGVESRGVKRAGFRVLVGHSRPAALVECGFLSNHSDAAALARPDYQAKVAAAIAEGLARGLARGN